ncbi:carbohydrate-binding module family 13 protein [Amanita muscaria Koide BX008]|uniref:Carbohydrate-binding module family 13 protein n=1 Tax=Amanita muscaria (strain Koide BX008) TaxID=946122 RepID=A0A0C2S8D2_AMAMK|nr:carbohydrate-binding module family 13 protein [Amanita muscaria Koide BX008]
MSRKLAIISAGVLLLSYRAHCQTPAFIGNLLLQPALNSGKCMTAASNNDGALVTIQTCTGGASQTWVFTNGEVRVFGNKCLDVTNGGNYDGNKLQIWTCYDGDTNQQWYYDVRAIPSHSLLVPLALIPPLRFGPTNFLGLITENAQI